MAALTAPTLSAEDPGRSCATGFTLLEILVTVVVATVISAALVSLIRGQSAFYSRQQVAVQSFQNIRAVHDLMGAEMRLAGGLDLLVARPDSVSLRTDVARAVVCDSTGPDEAVVFVYDSVSATNLLPGFVGVAIALPTDSTWNFSDATALQVLDTGPAPRSTCVGAGAPAFAPDSRYRRLSGFSAVPGGTPPRGSLLRFYGRLTYSISTTSGVSSLRRNSQELATPFGPIAFSYRFGDGSVTVAPPPVRYGEVVEVWVTGATPARAISGSAPRSFSLGLALRNGA